MDFDATGNGLTTADAAGKCYTDCHTGAFSKKERPIPHLRKLLAWNKLKWWR